MLLLLFSLVASACVCLIDGPDLVGPPPGSEVSGRFSMVLAFDSVGSRHSADAVLVRRRDGSPVDVERRWLGGSERRWLVLTPSERLPMGSSVELWVGGERRTRFSVRGGSMRSLAPPVLDALEHSMDSYGTNFDVEPLGELVYSSCRTGGPQVELGLQVPPDADWLEVEHAEDPDFAQATQSVHLPYGPVLVGHHACGGTDAGFHSGRRTYFRVRAVSASGAHSMWSQVGSVEVGNLDSTWPLLPGPHFPTTQESVESIAMQFFVSAGGVLAALMMGSVFLLLTSQWRSRREQERG